MGWNLLQELGIGQLRLLVNTMGDMETREGYVAILQRYFRENMQRVPQEIRGRIEVTLLQAEAHPGEVARADSGEAMFKTPACGRDVLGPGHPRSRGLAVSV